MDSLIEPIYFLPNPKIKPHSLEYILDSNSLYINLYNIHFKKDFILYIYPYTVVPKIDDGDARIRELLFKGIEKIIKSIFGYFFISGNNLYSMKKIDYSNNQPVILYSCHEITEYIININKYANKRIIKEEYINNDPLKKQLIELMVRNILNTNQKSAHCVGKGISFLKKDKRQICTKNDCWDLCQGIATSFIDIEKGKYLNIALKNIIMTTENILEYIRNNYKCKYSDKYRQDIRDELIGRSFKVSYLKRKHKIEEILFDRNPYNQIINYEGSTINLITYYKRAHRIEIKDKNQFLILVKKKILVEKYLIHILFLNYAIYAD